MFKPTAICLAILLLLSGMLACQKADEPAIAGATINVDPYQHCKVASKVIRGVVNSTTENTGEFTLDGLTYYLSKGRYTFKYMYDEQDRLTEEQEVNYSTVPYTNNVWHEEVNRTTYTYGPASIISQLYCNCVSTPKTATINSSGYVVADQYITYTYNAEGYLIQKKAQLYTVTYEYKDGNLINEKSVLTTANGTIIYSTTTTTYQYDLTRFNLPTVKRFYGKASRNLLTRTEVVETDAKGTGLPRVNTYQYQFDKQGRVTRQFEGTYHPSSVTDYTYICN